MPAYMVTMGMRDERPGLAAPKIDRQSWLGQGQTSISVRIKHPFDRYFYISLYSNVNVATSDLFYPPAAKFS